MIKYLKLLQQFDAAKIRTEIALLQSGFWNEHYNKAHYQGSWSVLPLRSLNGAVDNIISTHAVSESLAYRDTVLLDGCVYIKQVLDFFKCEKTSVRLMKLHSGAVIKEHCDQELSFEEGEVRFHIPVITHSEVAFYLEEERITMKAGECWYLNLSLKHRVQNNSFIDRIHLVIDCKVNDWIKNLFAENVSLRKERDDSPVTQYEREEKKKIIQELRLLNTPTAIQLANNLEKELK